MQNERINQMAVAQHAGVSQMTVSRVLSGRGPVAAKTRKRILEAIDALSYNPNPLAQGLRGARTRTVGILWSMSGPHPATEMARLISLKMQARGYVTYLADGLSDPKVIMQALREFLHRRVDGVVVQLTNMRAQPAIGQIMELLGQFPAAVAVPYQVNRDWSVDQVAQDSVKPFGQVAHHFGATGRKQPLLLIGRRQSQKVASFINALAGYGRFDLEQAVLQAYIPAVPHDPGVFCRMLDDRFGSRQPTFDAVMCSTDEGAVAVMQWLRRRGLAIPDDVAVVGFNDSPVSRYLDPPLASVQRQDEMVADHIERLLFARLSDPESPPQQVQIPMAFIHRASAG